MGLTIELQGLELWGHHGVEEDERRDGQRFLFDVWLDVSDGRRYRLLEPLAAAVADALLARFPVARVRVRVRKPDVRLDPAVEWSAVTAERVSGA